MYQNTRFIKLMNYKFQSCRGSNITFYNLPTKNDKTQDKHKNIIFLDSSIFSYISKPKMFADLAFQAQKDCYDCEKSA